VQPCAKKTLSAVEEPTAVTLCCKVLVLVALFLFFWTALPLTEATRLPHFTLVLLVLIFLRTSSAVLEKTMCFPLLSVTKILK
jgi:hypothetical protein